MEFVSGPWTNYRDRFGAPRYHEKIKGYLYFSIFTSCSKPCVSVEGVRVSPKVELKKSYILEGWNRSGEEYNVNGCNWK